MSRPGQVTNASAWHWTPIGEELSETPNEAEWEQVDWGFESGLYRFRLSTKCRTIQYAETSKPLPLESIFTHVNILKKPTYMLHYDVNALRKEVHRDPERFQELRHRYTRAKGKSIDVLDLLSQSNGLNIPILLVGRPGIGKTTFLKYLAIQGTRGYLNRVPVLADLTDWHTNEDLLDLLARSFEDERSQLPRTKPFLKRLLSKDKTTLVLLENLQATPPRGEGASPPIQTLRQFAVDYPQTQLLVTCRNGTIAHKPWFFRTVEMTDFHIGQMYSFVRKWFRAKNEAELGNAFWAELNRDENRAIRDMGCNPLFLTRLCALYRDPHQNLLSHRAKVYESVLGSLSSYTVRTEQIVDDTAYHHLSSERKTQMLAHLAAKSFRHSNYFLEQSKLVSDIEAFLKRLPPVDRKTLERESDIKNDGLSILKAIEAESGIITQCAQNLYSFAYLPFQEYYTACDVIGSVGADDKKPVGAILANAYDDRWREVILLAACKLKNADVFFKTLLENLCKLIKNEEELIGFLKWVKKKARSIDNSYDSIAVRAFYADLALDLGPDLDPTPERARTLIRALDSNLARDCALDRSTYLSLDRDMALDYALYLALDWAHTLYHASAWILYNGRSTRRTSILDRSSDRHRSFKQRLRRNLDHELDLAVGYAEDLDLNSLHKDLAHLEVPTQHATARDWQTFTGKLQYLMLKYRDIGKNWDFSGEQTENLKRYFNVASLSVQCLNISQVTSPETYKEHLFCPSKR